jgi:hypothetical protein
MKSHYRIRIKLSVVVALLFGFGLPAVFSLSWIQPAAADNYPLGDKGPWYRYPPKDANHGFTDLNTPNGSIQIEWWNWLRDDQEGPNKTPFRAWYYAYRILNIDYGGPGNPWIATFAFIFDDLRDLNIQGFAASTSDTISDPWHPDAWQKFSQWDPQLGMYLFGWQAASAPPPPGGWDDGVDHGQDTSGSTIYETPSGNYRGYYFEIVSFSRAPAPANVMVSWKDSYEWGIPDSAPAGAKDGLGINQDTGTIPGPGAPEMGTAFTFQGRLTETGKPASGIYDLQFELYDDPNLGIQLGPTELKEDRDLVDGYFTEVLDFGGSAFTGEARWLEIATRDGGSSDPNDFEMLRPRQQIRPMPYALYVASCGNADTVDGYHAGTASGEVAVSNGTVCTDLNADMVDGQHAGSLARRTVFYIPGGGGSTTFAIPHYMAFTITIAEAFGSPDNEAVGFVHCIENDGVIAWLGFNGAGTMAKGKTSLSSTTTILSLRSGNIALAAPGDGTLTLKASSVNEDVRGVVIW